MPDSHRFWAWFGASKVVDARQEPLVCYHGTHGQPNFGPLTRFGTAEAATEGLLLALTPEELERLLGDPEVTPYLDRLRFRRRSVWGDGEGYHLYAPGAAIAPCYLRIVRPLVLDEDPLLVLPPRHLKGIPDEALVILLAAGYDFRELVGTFKGQDPRTAVPAMLLAKGYDGVSFPDLVEGGGSTAWIILDASQAWPIYGSRITSGVSP